MTNKKRPMAFMSHSSTDKKFVHRLENDLITHGIDVWVDDKNITVGKSIPHEIEKGLEQSDFLLLCLTPRAVESGWVEKEWHSKFYEHVNTSEIGVFPVLVEDCSIPPFLRSTKYADFTKDYEEGLSQLLYSLKKVEISSPSVTSNVFDYTSDILEDLAGEFISIPLNRRIDIIGTLKKLPRSGKKARLDTFKPKIPIRSIYDHILSVAHTADCLLPVIDHDIAAQDLGELARCIAYHELNEVLLGDIPTYTEMSQNKRKSTRTISEERLRSVTPTERERIANEFIWMFLNDKHREAMQVVTEQISDRNSNMYYIFKVFDKMDPIICVWRYVHLYRGHLPNEGRAFLRRLRDFFENPDVRKFVREYGSDQKLLDLTATLQDRRSAERYYDSRDALDDISAWFGVPVVTLKMLIEGKPILFTETGQI